MGDAHGEGRDLRSNASRALSHQAHLHREKKKERDPLGENKGFCLMGGREVKIRDSLVFRETQKRMRFIGLLYPSLDSPEKGGQPFIVGSRLCSI